MLEKLLLGAQKGSCSSSVSIAVAEQCFVVERSPEHRVDMLCFIGVWHTVPAVPPSKPRGTFESDLSGEQQCPHLAREACGKAGANFPSTGLNMKCSVEY